MTERGLGRATRRGTGSDSFTEDACILRMCKRAIDNYNVWRGERKEVPLGKDGMVVGRKRSTLLRKVSGFVFRRLI